MSGIRVLDVVLHDVFRSKCVIVFAIGSGMMVPPHRYIRLLLS